MYARGKAAGCRLVIARRHAGEKDGEKRVIRCSSSRNLAANSKEVRRRDGRSRVLIARAELATAREPPTQQESPFLSLWNRSPQTFRSLTPGSESSGARSLPPRARRGRSGSGA